MVSKEGKHKMDSLRPAAWANQHVAYSGQMERKKFSNVHQLTPTTPTPIPLYPPSILCKEDHTLACLTPD